MSNHEGFARAVAADPFNTLPALVWADHLDEIGLPGVAEIIRRAAETHEASRGRPGGAGNHHFVLANDAQPWVGFQIPKNHPPGEPVAYISPTHMGYPPRPSHGFASGRVGEGPVYGIGFRYRLPPDLLGKPSRSRTINAIRRGPRYIGIAATVTDAHRIFSGMPGILHADEAVRILEANHPELRGKTYFARRLARGRHGADPDHAAFIRHIMEAPGDQVRYLAFADYLDEQQHHAAAAVIRKVTEEYAYPRPGQVPGYYGNQTESWRRPGFYPSKSPAVGLVSGGSRPSIGEAGLYAMWAAIPTHGALVPTHGALVAPFLWWHSGNVFTPEEAHALLSQSDTIGAPEATAWLEREHPELRQRMSRRGRPRRYALDDATASGLHGNIHATIHSGDALPHLVYADHLEENGQTAAAEFIRLAAENMPTNELAYYEGSGQPGFPGHPTYNVSPYSDWTGNLQAWLKMQSVHTRGKSMTWRVNLPPFQVIGLLQRMHDEGAVPTHPAAAMVIGRGKPSQLSRRRFVRRGRPRRYSHEAFGREILSKPQDQLPSLVYADWLEENGKPTYAGLIRHHIQRQGEGGWGPHYISLGEGRAAIDDDAMSTPGQPVANAEWISPSHGYLVYVTQYEHNPETGRPHGYYYSQSIRDAGQARDTLHNLESEGVRIHEGNHLRGFWQPRDRRRFARNEDYNRLFVEAAHAHPGVQPHEFEEFANLDHFGIITNVARGDRDLAHDLATRMLYGNTRGTGGSFLAGHDPAKGSIAQRFTSAAKNLGVWARKGGPAAQEDIVSGGRTLTLPTPASVIDRPGVRGSAIDAGRKVTQELAERVPVAAEDIPTDPAGRFAWAMAQHAKGMKHPEIARHLGTTRSTVSKSIRNKTGAIYADQGGSRSTGRDTHARVLDLHGQGKGYKEIAAATGLKYHTVFAIIRRNKGKAKMSRAVPVVLRLRMSRAERRHRLRFAAPRDANMMGFHRAIQESYNRSRYNRRLQDPMPHLVYADWLEEHGHTAAAQIIREHQEHHADQYGNSFRYTASFAGRHEMVAPGKFLAVGKTPDMAPEEQNLVILRHGMLVPDDEQHPHREGEHSQMSWYSARRSPEELTELLDRLRAEGVPTNLHANQRFPSARNAPRKFAADPDFHDTPPPATSLQGDYTRVVQFQPGMEPPAAKVPPGPKTQTYAPGMQPPPAMAKRVTPVAKPAKKVPVAPVARDYIPKEEYVPKPKVAQPADPGMTMHSVLSLDGDGRPHLHTLHARDAGHAAEVFGQKVQGHTILGVTEGPPGPGATRTVGKPKKLARPLRYSHEAFIAKILSEPEEKINALAYADWLEEGGNPGHAEVVRHWVNNYGAPHFITHGISGNGWAGRRQDRPFVDMYTTFPKNDEKQYVIRVLKNLGDPADYRMFGHVAVVGPQDAHRIVSTMPDVLNADESRAELERSHPYLAHQRYARRRPRRYSRRDYIAHFQAIHDNLEDQMPRMVFADRIEEHGFTAYPEALRRSAQPTPADTPGEVQGPPGSTWAGGSSGQTYRTPDGQHLLIHLTPQIKAGRPVVTIHQSAHVNEFDQKDFGVTPGFRTVIPEFHTTDSAFVRRLLDEGEMFTSGGDDSWGRRQRQRLLDHIAWMDGGPQPHRYARRRPRRYSASDIVAWGNGLHKDPTSYPVFADWLEEVHNLPHLAHLVRTRPPSLPVNSELHPVWPTAMVREEDMHGAPVHHNLHFIDRNVSLVLGVSPREYTDGRRLGTTGGLTIWTPNAPEGKRWAAATQFTYHDDPAFIPALIREAASAYRDGHVDPEALAQQWEQWLAQQPRRMARRKRRFSREDETAFHRMIHENPRDQMPSLAYADWLEENGRPFHAEAIRRGTQFNLQRSGGRVAVDVGHTAWALPPGTTWVSADPYNHLGVRWGGPFDKGGNRLANVWMWVNPLSHPGSRLFYRFNSTREDAERIMAGLHSEGAMIHPVNRVWTPPREEPEKFAAYKAPAGGLVVRGMYYQGGKIVPDLQKYGNPEGGRRGMLRAALRAKKQKNSRPGLAEARSAALE